jgi:polyisoprenyl-phosphate glycosyltransferase
MTAGRPFISVVAPAYCCSECLPELHRRLCGALEALTSDFEIILVNDASPHRDWEVISELARNDPRVKGINLSRNFGQHHAITAGVDHARGDWVVVMDCDLQDQPEEIPKLYWSAVSGPFDIVFGRRVARKDAWLKIVLSRAFNVVFRFLADTRLDPSVANFSIASREVMDVYRSLREAGRSHGLTLLWCGYRVGFVDVEHAERFAGATTYSFQRSINLALEAITARSNKPLLVSIKLGFLIAGLSILFGFYILWRKLVLSIPVTGWASMIVSLYFLGGLLMANLGVVGLYLGKVFDQTRNRPLYVVRESINLADAPVRGPGAEAEERRGPPAAE